MTDDLLHETGKPVKREIEPGKLMAELLTGAKLPIRGSDIREYNRPPWKPQITDFLNLSPHAAKLVDRWIAYVKEFDTRIH